MTRITQWCVVAIAGSLMSGVGLYAQQPTDVMQIESAAAVYAAAHIVKSSNFVFDATPTGGPSVRGSSHVPTRTASDAASLARALRATRLGNKADFYTCADRRPSTCAIKGADMIVSLSRPTVSGDTAFVVVTKLRSTGLPRVPVARNEERIQLMKRNGSWVADGVAAGGGVS